jgi:hypothetical protein
MVAVVSAMLRFGEDGLDDLVGQPLYWPAGQDREPASR